MNYTVYKRPHEKKDAPAPAIDQCPNTGRPRAHPLERRRPRQPLSVSVTTIRRAELMPSATALTRVNDDVIREALEQAGVEFIDENGGGPGVRLRCAATIRPG